MSCLEVTATGCVSGEASQFGFLELSQTQDLCGEAVNSQEEDGDKCNKLSIRTFIHVSVLHCHYPH